MRAQNLPLLTKGGEVLFYSCLIHGYQSMLLKSSVNSYVLAQMHLFTFCDLMSAFLEAALKLRNALRDVLTCALIVCF